jgi:hypothetical protein
VTLHARVRRRGRLRRLAVRDCRRAPTAKGTYVLFLRALPQADRDDVLREPANELVGLEETKSPITVFQEVIDAGKLTPMVDRTFPLSEVPKPSAISIRETSWGRSSSPFDARTAATPSPIRKSVLTYANMGI